MEDEIRPVGSDGASGEVAGSASEAATDSGAMGSPSQSVPLWTDFQVAVEFDVDPAEAFRAKEVERLARLSAQAEVWSGRKMVGLSVLGALFLVMVLLLPDYSELTLVSMCGLAMAARFGPGLLRRGGRNHRRLEVSAEGIINPGALLPHTPWSKLSRVVETSEFFLFLDRDSHQYLPKRVMASNDRAALRKIVMAHMHDPDHAILFPLVPGSPNDLDAPLTQKRLSIAEREMGQNLRRGLLVGFGGVLATIAVQSVLGHGWDLVSLVFVLVLGVIFLAFGGYVWSGEVALKKAKASMKELEPGEGP